MKRITWADKLNKLSLYLPSGVWITDISVTSKDFILKGSVISLVKDELTLINTFLDRLKADKEFFINFENIELSSIERRGVGSYEVADFTLNGKLKTK
jgi:ligand-binding sensor protein